MLGPHRFRPPHCPPGLTPGEVSRKLLPEREPEDTSAAAAAEGAFVMPALYASNLPVLFARRTKVSASAPVSNSQAEASRRTRAHACSREDRHIVIHSAVLRVLHGAG